MWDTPAYFTLSLVSELQDSWYYWIVLQSLTLIAKQMLNYVPNGRRRLGTPLKRLLYKAKTGLLGLICDDKELYP